MARPRNFSETDALDQLAAVFTARGYGGTSVGDLTEATGLGKQSLYNAFGDKQSLYLQAIDHSAARFGQKASKAFAEPTGRAAIEAFFQVLLKACMSNDEAENNCIVSAGLLEGIQDEPIAERLCERWVASRQALKALIERGREDGSVRKDCESQELADVLMTLMSGLRVTARVVTKPAQLKRIVQLNLAVLDP
jgi:TetR/AcrR family transcriptional regulator, transcriptional repressor for nem operon